MPTNLLDCHVTSIDDILSLYSAQNDKTGRELILRAYMMADQAHAGQTRKSGEPYISHPVAVAGTLACMRLDAPTIAAALLHDVAEDTSVTIQEIREIFGTEISVLVDSVTKISRREGLVKDINSPTNESTSQAVPSVSENGREEAFLYKTNREAESLRKMFLGIANDVRVVLIKLSDRLHNVSTLDSMPPDKRKRIGRETLEIYAPLANRLGMWEWKQQLEEWGFRYAEPDVWLDITQRLEEGAVERNKSINRQIEFLKRALIERGVSNVEISGRAKQPYSISRKMQKKKLVFDQIMDLRAMRVIIEDRQNDAVEALLRSEDILADHLSEEERQRRARDIGAMRCYEVLYVVHNLWKPIKNEFDDFISKPKDNHYQSLHTAVIVDDGRPLEVQIRTRSMHQAAEFGVAAHWLYKEAEVLSVNYQKYLDAWREDMRSLSSNEEDAFSFTAAAVQANRELDEKIYCFTPRGRVIELPRGATVLDFAYHIHTDLGHRCRGGWVNGKFVPINHELHSDDQVNIATKNDAVPSRNWLVEGTVKTATARNKIRTWLSRQDRAQNIAGGRQMVEQAIRRVSAGQTVKVEDVYAMFKSTTQSLDDFLDRVGRGIISVNGVTSRIIEQTQRRRREQEVKPAITESIAQRFRRTATAKLPKSEFCVAGTYDVYAVQATCCNPRPGDTIIGYTTRGEGVKVHRTDCKNLLNSDPNRLIEVVHVSQMTESVPVEIMIEAVERPGLLNDVTNLMTGAKANIIDFGFLNRDAAIGEVRLWFKTELPDPNEVGLLMGHLSQLKHVYDVYLTHNKQVQKGQKD
jgi:GTP pyrophosphokinase